jgi:hypothetical protein
LEFRHALPLQLQQISDEYFNMTATEATEFSGTNGTKPTRRQHKSTTNVSVSGPWGASLEIVKGSSGTDLARLVWSDPDQSADFYFVWYRRVNDPDSTIRCLTSDEDYTSTKPISEMNYSLDDCLAAKVSNISASDERTCRLPPNCTQFPRAQGNRSSYLFTTAALFHPRKSVAAFWGAIDPCSAVGFADFDVLLFVTRCTGTAQAYTCDLQSPSQAVLAVSSCNQSLIATAARPLQDATVILSPISCVKNSAISPFGLYCDDGGSWSAWQCATDDDGLACVESTKPTGELGGLSPCFHKDRFLIRGIACMSTGCEQSIITDDVLELEFQHPSGVRAVQCLSKPSARSAKVGVAAAGIVGGVITITLGSSTAAAVTGSASSTAAGSLGFTYIVDVLSSVQFVALTSDLCEIQSSIQLQAYMDTISHLNMFNLRIPIPHFIYEWSSLFEILSFCGMPPVDLAAQARADVGDLFSGNMVFGFFMFSTVTSLHVLLLLPSSPKLRKFMLKRIPFLKLELYAMILGFQGFDPLPANAARHFHLHVNATHELPSPLCTPCTLAFLIGLAIFGGLECAVCGLL